MSRFKLVNGDLIALEEYELADRLAESNKAELEYNNDLYKYRRIDAYPSVGDQLDAIWKYLSTKELDRETELMYNKILDVKERFPK